MSVIDEYLEKTSIMVTDMIEHEDGSATLKIDTDEKTKARLIQEGLISIIIKALDETNEEYHIDPSLLDDNNKEE